MVTAIKQTISLWHNNRQNVSADCPEPRCLEDEIASASKRAVCCSCGGLSYITDNFQVVDKNPLLNLLEGKLDACTKHGDPWNIC